MYQYKDHCNDEDMLRTTHIPHGDLEAFPVPVVSPTMHVAHHRLELVEASFGIGAEIVLRDLVPVLLRHAACLAALLYLPQPLLDWGIAGGIALEDGRRRPRIVYGLEIEWLDLERVDDDGHVSRRKQ